jgi:MFS family permease
MPAAGAETRDPAASPRRDFLLVALLSLNFGAAFLARNAVGFVAPFLGPGLTLTNTELGALSAALGLSWALAGAGVARLPVARFGTQRVLAALSLVGALALFWTAAATGFASALASRLVAGATAGPVMPLSQALVAVHSTPANRGARMGTMQAVGGSLIGNILAPAILVPVAVAWGGRTALVAAGACCLLVAAVVIVNAVRQHDRGEAPGAVIVARPSARRSYATRNLWVCCLLSVLLIGWLIVVLTFLPTFLMRTLGWSGARMGFVLGGFGVVSMAASIALPAFSDRVGRRRAMLTGAATGALAAFAAWHGVGGTGTAIAAMCIGVAGGTFPLFMAAIPAESAPAGRTAAWIGRVQATGEIVGGGAAPLLAGIAADRFAPSSALLIAAACVAAAAVVSLALVETHDTKAAR